MQKGTHIRLVLWRAEKAFEKVDLKSIAETGLCNSDFAILEALFHKGPLQIGQIGEKVLLTSGSMTAAVNRLERIGYVKRIKKIEDARCFDVALAPEGRKVIEAAWSKHEKNLEMVAEVLTPEEREELVRLLKKIGYHTVLVESQMKDSKK